MDTPLAQWRNKLLRQIQHSRLLKRSRRIVWNDTPGLIGTIVVENRGIQLIVLVDPLFQNQLPVFILQPWDALGFIPHIDPQGIICFLEQEGIIFDWYRPFEVFQACVDHVRRTLREGLRGINQHDFVDEFEVYWRRLQPSLVALSNFEPSDHVSELVIGFSPDADPSLRLSPTITSLRRIANPLLHHESRITPRIRNTVRSMFNHPLNQKPWHISRGSTSIHYSAAEICDHGPWMVSKAIYLPLNNGTLLVPPRSDRPFWDIDAIVDLLKYCSSENRERFEQIAKQRVSNNAYVILGLSRPSGGKALFGLYFDGVQEQHPLMGGSSKQCTPVVIIRCDKHYLVQRGGGNMTLTNKRVLLLGCGAVGGHMAFELSRAGIEQLVLLDPDTLQAQNTYRHVLGKQYWEINKALALKQALRMQLPFSQAQAITSTIEAALEAHHVNLTDYDLIISAMGNPTSERALNAYLCQLENRPPIIFTWLDPFGIGGHALLTGLHGASGCFECLYSDPSGGCKLYNRASFAASDQTFRRSLAGCDSLHTPYGSLDAAKTAHMAVRLAIDVLIGKENQNRLRSWKGDADRFTEAKFILAPRYQLSADTITAQETTFVSPTCHICGVKINEMS